jgi:hypothetical protein
LVAIQGCTLNSSTAGTIANPWILICPTTQVGPQGPQGPQGPAGVSCGPMPSITVTLTGLVVSFTCSNLPSRLTCPATFTLSTTLTAGDYVYVGIVPQSQGAPTSLLHVSDGNGPAIICGTQCFVDIFPEVDTWGEMPIGTCTVGATPACISSWNPWTVW